MVRQDENSVRQDKAALVSQVSLLDWPASMYFFLLCVAVLYAPTLLGAAQQWIKNDNYAHGFFIFPISIFLLWMRKDQIKEAERKPEAWGLILLAVGLVIEMGSYLLQIKYIGMWSLVLTLAGGILSLHGRNLWKIAQFSVWFLLFAAPFSNTVLGHITTVIQSLSTIGASEMMSLLGYPVLRHGNVLQVPGATLEVAAACSGFHKLVSLLAFSAIYGHLFLDSTPKRALLLAMAVPIALLVNVLRIASLVAAAIYGGLPGLHATHDPAEIVAIGVAFALFVLVGKKLGGKGIGDLPIGTSSSETAINSVSPDNQKGRYDSSRKKTATLALIASLMVVGGAGLDYALGPMAVAVPHQLAVDTFPGKLGSWQGGTIAPVDPDIQARLPTSKIMDRDYRDARGNEADVMLVTASDNLDIHNPLDCFPSQGWKLSNYRQKIVDGQQVNVMDAQLDEQKMTVMYWTTGYYMPPPSPHAFVRTISAMRTNILGRRQADSLFVRLMVPANPNSEEALTQLAGQVMPPVQSLLEAGRRSGEQIASNPAKPAMNLVKPTIILRGI